MEGSLFKQIRDREIHRAGAKFQKLKHNHSLSYAPTGKRCKCGRDHQSIDILDADRGMRVIESEVCPFMYNVRNACLRVKFGDGIPKIDSELLQKVTKC